MIFGLKSFGNSCTKFYILDIKCGFTCGDSDLKQGTKKLQKIMSVGCLKSFVIISTLSMMIQLCREIKVKLDKSTKIWYLIVKV